MKFLNLKIIRDYFYRLNSFQIFVLSFSICLLFYITEGILGIDRFYHPDSAHYLKKNYNFNLSRILSNPTYIFHKGYYVFSDLLNNNYYLLISANFVLYSFTNIMIYQKVFKNYFTSLTNLKLFFLFYLLFLDPYRLHLASHVLKETILIFIMITIILSNFKMIKIIFTLLLEVFRNNSLIYLLIFFTYSNIKKITRSIKKIVKSKIIYIIFFLLIFLSIVFLILNKNIHNFILIEFEKFINLIENYYYKLMPIRSYDHVPLFRDFGFPTGFILKNITWPLMLVSGFFIFFTSSFLFKFLGLVIILNNLLIYTITKKTYISLGLLIILLIISIYTSSYTPMFRYSYIAIYSSVIYFFYKAGVKKL
jgi:hypothetical protein